jgi:LPXTG-motif cell wall-anchored protein
VAPLRIMGPTSVIAGGPARYAVVRPPGTRPKFRWDFEGAGRFSAASGLPWAKHVFRWPGTFLVSLLVLERGGSETVAHLQVAVLAPHIDANHRQARVHRVRARAPTTVAREAADPSVTIKDFSFGPAAITIHAGETVTWVNEGPSSHTATAAGVFNTGVLHAGQSASQQFTHAGTFSYRCSIHPFMRGTVTVLAASGSSGAPSASGTGASDGGASSTPAQASGGSSATASPPGPTAPGPTLPNTGVNTRTELIAGLAMLALGAALLLGAARRPRAPANRRRD